MDRGFAAVANDITDIKNKMATKDDIANLGGQLTSVERQLKSIAGISTISEKRSRMFCATAVRAHSRATRRGRGQGR